MKQLEPILFPEIRIEDLFGNERPLKTKGFVKLKKFLGKEKSLH